MKVGTDGVLLGAWAGVRPSDRRILDVGTGTGLIALMMAQRAPEALITGVDVEEVSQARENAAASPWGGRVVFEQCPVQEFAPDERFDLILSNPPFFVDSLTCPDEGRLLAAEGRFAVILPTDEARRFADVCRGFLALTRSTGVRTTPCRPVKRMLMEFAHENACSGLRSDSPPVCSELVVGTGEHEQYTPEYRALTRDFYLKF
mgnify:CR=1 FL=1